MLAIITKELFELGLFVMLKLGSTMIRKDVSIKKSLTFRILCINWKVFNFMNLFIVRMRILLYDFVYCVDDNLLYEE